MICRRGIPTYRCDVCNKEYRANYEIFDMPPDYKTPLCCDKHMIIIKLENDE